MPPDPLVCSHVSARNGRTSLNSWLRPCIIVWVQQFTCRWNSRKCELQIEKEWPRRMEFTKFYWLLMKSNGLLSSALHQFGSMYAGVTTTRHRATLRSGPRIPIQATAAGRWNYTRHFQRTVCSTKRTFFHTLYLMLPVRREPKSKRPHILAANSYSCWATECWKVVVNVTSHLNWDAW